MAWTMCMKLAHVILSGFWTLCFPGSYAIVSPSFWINFDLILSWDSLCVLTRVATLDFQMMKDKGLPPHIMIGLIINRSAITVSLEITKKKIGISIYSYYSTQVVIYMELWRVAFSGIETGCPNIFQRNVSPQKCHHYTPWQFTPVTNNVHSCLLFWNLHWTSKLGSQIAKVTPKLPSCGQQPSYTDCSLKSV